MLAKPINSTINLLCRLSCSAYGALVAGCISDWRQDLLALSLGAIIGFALSPMFIHIFTAGVASFVRPSMNQEENLRTWITVVIPMAATLMIFMGLLCLMVLYTKMIR